MEVEKKGRRVCVTGAGGYVASWLVKLLLSHGYNVHGTVRDPSLMYKPLSFPSSDKKNEHLKNLDKASENLQLFKTDLLDYDSLLAAIAGCEGVFHVASPVPAVRVPDPEVEVISPAVTGTLNVLKACSTLKIRRAVVVSAAAAIQLNPYWPRDKVMDEDCWSDREFLRNNQDWYFLSKTLAEAEALEYGKKNELDVITVCPSYILGPLLQPTVNASSLFLLSLLKGQRESLDDRVYHIVDVRDVADALLLVYEKLEASGRYACTAHLLRCHDLIDLLKSMYPNYKYPTQFNEVDFQSAMTSEKLKKLGWQCKPLKETIADSVECYKEAGLLEY